MNRPLAGGARRTKKNQLQLPREHGFWTMLAATQLVSVAKVGGSLRAFGVSLAVIALATLGAVLVSKMVRRNPSLQIVLAVALGGTGIPVELFAGGDPSEAVQTALAWCSVFAASALLVRSVFLRRKVEAGRAPSWKLWALEVGALVLCGLSAAAFAAWGRSDHALALVVATLFLGGLGALRPGPKQLKPLGLSLAALMLVLCGVLVYGEALGARLMF